MPVSAETMQQLLEKEGTPPKYRNRYLWLIEKLLGWRYSHQLGSWDTGTRSLPENIVLRMLRTHGGMETVIQAMFDRGWLMMLATFQGPGDRSICYKVQFVNAIGQGGTVLATTMIDAVLLAAWRAHRKATEMIDG